MDNLELTLFTQLIQKSAHRPYNIEWAVYLSLAILSASIHLLDLFPGMLSVGPTIHQLSTSLTIVEQKLRTLRDTVIEMPKRTLTLRSR